MQEPRRNWKGRGSKGAFFFVLHECDQENIMKKCMIAETRPLN